MLNYQRDIEEICAVEGVDCLVLAAFDLSTSLGISGKFNHPDFLAAQAKVERAVFASGLPLFGNALTRDQADALLTRGYKCIAGFDVLWLRQKAVELQSRCVT